MSNYSNAESIDQVIIELNALKKKNYLLSYLSTQFLTTDYEQQLAFIQQIKQNQFKLINCVTCIAEIKQTSEEAYSRSQLVVGTELMIVYILDQNGTAIESSIKIADIPYKIIVKGTLKNYQLIIGTKNDMIIIATNGSATNNIYLEAKGIDLCKIDQSLHVACTDKKVHTFDFNWNKLYALSFKHFITNISPFIYGRNKEIQGILIALRNMELRLYSQRQLIYTLVCEDIISSLCFGNFGREEGFLIIIYKKKGIDMKVLERNFSFSKFLSSQTENEQNESLVFNIPKKTRLFLEDTQRERDCAQPMHKNLQKDLMKLKFNVCQSYLHLLQESSPIQIQSNQASSASALHLHASIQGLGPFFNVVLEIENMSQNVFYTGLVIGINAREEYFKILKMNPVVGFVPPQGKYTTYISVENIDANGNSDIIRISVTKREKQVPIAMINVEMPVSELKFE